MDKGNKDQHRMTYSGRVKAVETSKWGADKAIERYGNLPNPDMKPKDMTRPQDPIDKQGPSNDVSPNSWLRGGGRGGEGYKYFDRSKKR